MKGDVQAQPTFSSMIETTRAPTMGVDQCFVVPVTR